jgi:glycosyltransferase involved in cell wall biosynthesis|tara:strand:+ start:2846 stop:3709 length:864 start_codon:yes stop_codon:yes gene_type:complete
MINLFYEEAYWGHASRMNGPKKVVHNLVESLEQEGIPYAVNVEEYDRNFLVQYDWTGHVKHSKLTLDHCVIGPQVWVFDEHVKELQQNPHYYKSIIAPSQWVKDLFVSKFSYPENKVAVWPVGIELPNIQREEKYDCLVYFKRRTRQELEKVISFLDSKQLTYNILEYGSYEPEQVNELAAQSKFCFLLNGTESQGIAVQEIMACGIPMFVWDITEWNDQGDQYQVPATSVPFWDDACGERVFDSNFDMTFDQFYSKLEEYNPRKYVEENLSYKQSVKTLMEIFDAA